MVNAMATYVDLVSGVVSAHFEQQKAIVVCVGGNYDHGKCVRKNKKRENWRYGPHACIQTKATDLEIG